MATMYCPCEAEHELWAELLWVGRRHQWVYFDNRRESETYVEQVTHCPSCGRRIEHRNLRLR